MAANQKQIDIVVDAKVPGVAKVKAAADSIKKELTGLKALKGGLGEESAFGSFAKIASGAGAVAGLALAGRELNKLADKSGEIRKQLADGAGAGEIAEDLAKSIPIYGEVIESGRKFRAILDGSAAAVDKLNDENKLTTAYLDAQAAGYKKHREELDKILKTTQDIRDATALIGRAEPGRSLTSLDQQLAKSRKESADALEAKIAEIRSRRTKEITDLGRALTNQGTAIGDAQENVNDAQTAFGANSDSGNRYRLEASQQELREAKARYDVIASQVKALKAKQDDDLRTETGALRENLAASEKLIAAQKNEIRKKADEEDFQRQVQLEKRLFETKSTIRQNALKEEGDALAQQLDKIKSDFLSRGFDIFHGGRNQLNQRGSGALPDILLGGLRESLLNKNLSDQERKQAINASIRDKLRNLFGAGADALGGLGFKPTDVGSFFGSAFTGRRGDITDPDAPLGGRPGFQSFRFGSGAAGFSPLESDANRQTRQMAADTKRGADAAVAIAAAIANAEFVPTVPSDLA